MGLCGRDGLSGEQLAAVTILMKIESLSATIFRITFPLKWFIDHLYMIHSPVMNNTLYISFHE